ncbi:Uncharacterized membrane protein YkvI [Anaerobranca californiensis DSM 14826]|uniref:Uncharacterized membrane protein YkvI n=1 Tax=Anaerobranca californiensis DSM 14826 TaxID=1120989 RepID=A0A1M6M369_9FIRM|nr:hypothetical protein [Anaerobranca californiensis]SHJ77899.1 Uncharacterized membrane protein YkvI [Anaerobranca californiensis DSM 14826]
MNRESSKIALTYVGVIVGAGFATGQEIFQFFVRFKNQGYIGAIVSTLGFILFGWIFLKIVYEEPIYNYYDLLQKVVGGKVIKLIDLIITLFLLGSFTIMIAAAHTLFINYIIPNNFIAYLIIITALWLSFINGIKGIININGILIPFLFFIVVILCSYSLLSEQTFPTSTSLIPRNYLFSSVIYVSYNLIIGMVVLSSLKKEIYNKKTVIIAPLLAGILLGLMLLLMIGATSKLVSPSDLPIMDLTINLNQMFSWLLIIAIGIAILTSALGIGFGLISRLEERLKLNYHLMVVLLLVTGISVSLIGFAPLVGYVYPFFGFLNLYIMLCSIKYIFCKMLKSKKGLL